MLPRLEAEELVVRKQHLWRIMDIKAMVGEPVVFVVHVQKRKEVNSSFRRL